MAYFVTGATGFIGRRLVARLLEEHRGNVYILVRPGSAEKLEHLREQWGRHGKRVIPVTGDLTQPGLGVSAADTAKLKGEIRHFFHLAAVYDLRATAEAQQKANVDGTRHATEFAEAVEAGCFHLMSSIAAAGLYPGVFREDMFEEAENLDHPYFRTKHDAEAIVRNEYGRPWRVYRPGLVVGDSRTGEAVKIDGPYYFFKTLQKLRDLLPKWMPAVGLEGGYINIVPVDFVVAALDHIAHKRGLDGRAFHLVDPKPHRVGEILDIFARAAHAPELAGHVNARLLELMPRSLKLGLSASPALRKLWDGILDDLGLPPDALRFVNWPTRYDNRETQAILDKAGIQVPPLESYAWRLWDYWERQMDPDLFLDRTLHGTIAGKTVLVTGGSSGIGKATATKLAKAGARVVICARGEDKLQAAAEEIRAAGGEVGAYVCDLTDQTSVDTMVERLLAEYGGVDVLINNAGRSIRRSILHSLDRLHDYERTMALNYTGCVRITLALLPSMLKRNSGHVINISSIGVVSNAPRFSAYVASKAALEAFSRCAGGEFADTGVDFTIINMPLVRTPMIAPTQVYANAPTLTPDQAADLVAKAIIERPEQLTTRLGKMATLVHAVSPKLMQAIMNSAYHLFPDSAAATGHSEEEHHETAEQAALKGMLKGIHL
ncbi:SDR family oxidoreductase [Ectothiorhodospiraceae bacterium WFHF3C12]|nr:SDR family oxidoreductase [Ectothiorhodospiraceae bacterium WFHF3C12]